MNGTVKKRIVAGLLALGMIFSPTGAGITTIPSFAESGVSVNAEDDAAGGDETAENGEDGSEDGETDSEDGETASDGGDADPNNGETDPDKGESKNEEASAEETAGAEFTLDPKNVEVIGADPILEQSGSGVLPYKLYVFNDVIELSGELSARSLPVNAGYEPTVYASTEGYDGLNAKQKKVYEQLYARALEIDNSDEDYGDEYKFKNSNDPVYLFGKNTSGSDLPAAEDLVGYVFCDAGTSSDDIYKAYTALGYDNPQLFWYGHSLTGYSFRTSSGKITFAVVLSTEVEDYANGAKRQAAKTELYNKIDEIVMGAAAYANGYSVEWYIHDYLCKNTIYDPNFEKSNKSPYNHDVTGLLLHNICVCESYAKCTQLLINAITNAYDLGDLDVRYVVGMAYSYNGSKYVLGGGHAWNQILLDGQWYNFDATWDDIAPEYQEEYGEYFYRYFNVTDDPFTKEHHAFEYYEKMYSTSKCTATDYSYDNHEYNYAKEEDIRFTVSVNGKTVFKAASVEGALHYINRTKNVKNDYVIKCIGEDVPLTEFTNAVTLGNANSITFTGPTRYMFSAGFTANCDVIFDSYTALSGKVTSSAKTVTLSGDCKFLGIGKDSEVAFKTLVLENSDEDPVEVINFGAKSFNIANLVSTAKIKNFIQISSDAVLGNITTTGDFDLRVSVDADVSVTGKVVYNTAKLNLIPMKVSGSGSEVSYDNVKIENGTTILEATTAAATCFKSSYVFTETDSGLSEDVNYAVYKEGKEVKLTLPRVYVYGTYDNYGAFATFDEAVAAINADKNLNGKYITIELADNVETEKMAMPSKVEGVELRSAGSNNYKIDVTANTVSFPTNVTIGNVRISTKDTTKGLTISAAKNIWIQGLTSDNLAAIKGTAKGGIIFNKTFGYCSITGFDRMVIWKDFECGTINVGTLIIDDCNLNVKQSNASVTVKNIESTGDAAIVYAKGAKPITVTAGATGGITVTTDDTGFTEGQKLITAKTADMSVFKLDQDKVPKDCANGYTLSRNGSDLCAAKVTMKVESTEDENDLMFAKWTDVVSTIEARNDKAGYAVQLLDNVNVNGALKMPKAGTYSELYFNGNGKKLVFTGNITLTGDTVFDSVDLVSVKKTNKGNEGAAYSIAAGKYDLKLYKLNFEPTTLTGLVDANADNAGLANITSSGTVRLGGATVNGSITSNDIVIFAVSEELLANAVEACNSFAGSELAKTSVIVGGNLTAKSVLKIYGSLTVKGAFSAAGIQADSGAKLYLYQGKKPADIGKTGFIGSKTVEFALLGADGKTVEIKNVQVIANIKGKYADHLVPVNENIDTDEQEVGYYIVKSGTQLIAKPKNTEFMKVKVNGKTAYYPDYDSIIKDITTVADPSAYYTIYFDEEVTLDKLTLPGAKKYGRIVFAAEGSTATIKTLSDLTLTGNLIIDNNVTVNKYDKGYKDIVDINVNAGAYRFECKGKLSYKGEANHLGKLAGAKNSSIDLYNSETWEVSTAVAANDLGLDGGALVLGDKASLTLTGEISEAIVKYPFANASKIKFGKIRGIELVSTDSTTVKDGTYLANVTGEVLGGIGAEGFDAIRSGNKLIAGDMNKAMLVMNEKEHAGCFYDTFENAIAGITAANNPDVDYTLYLWKDITVKKLTLPAAKKYKSLTLASRFGNAGTITTESDIVLTGDLTNGVGINKVKSGKIVPISINTGTYTFNCGVLSNDEGTTSYIANITGKGIVKFNNDVEISGNVNVGTFVVSSTVTLGEKSGFTCTNLVPDNGKLVYTEKNASKVKLGNVKYNSNSITFPMLGEGKLLANITGDIALSSVKFGMDDETNLDDTYRAARKGNKLYIVKIADAVIMTDEDGINRSYCSPEDALTDIARINDPEGEYLICLNKDWTPKKFALPAKGKYASIKFVFDDVKGATITVPSDITLTGDLIIGANVTLKKASGTLKINAPKRSGFTASTEGTGKIIGTGAIE